LAFPAVAEATAATKFTITALAAGQTCWYKISTVCGAPAFKPSSLVAEIEYIDIPDSAVTTVTPVAFGAATNSNAAAKKAASPAVGMPARSTVFEQEVGGNKVHW
jgi:hypothetical protein